MATDLETQIIQEIGFPSHWQWSEGASCKYIAYNAPKKLAKVVLKHHQQGDKIIPLPEKFTELLFRIVESESERSLKCTWEACSMMIEFCIHQARGIKRESATEFEKRLLREYLSRQSKRNGW